MDVKTMTKNAVCLVLAVAILLSGIPAPVRALASDAVQSLQFADTPAFSTINIPLEFPEAVWQQEGKYVRLLIEGCPGVTQKPDAPALPFWADILSLPLSSRILDVKIRNAVYHDHIITEPISPAPEPVAIVDGAVICPLSEGPDYSSNRLYPGNELESRLTTGSSGRGGIEAHLAVKVFPLRYNPVSGQVRQLTGAELVVRYIPGAAPVPRGNATYDILVLTPPQFQSEMERYEDAKTAVGYRVKTVNLTELYGNVYFNVSTGRDNPEKIKLFIKQALENWTIRFVTIAGDTDMFPVRRAYIADGYDGYDTPADYYYGDIFKAGTTTFDDWDKDRDNLFAESTTSVPNADSVDFDPDVSVGRYPASNEAELRNALNKSFAYAENLTNGSWFRNVTLVGTDTFDPAHYPSETSNIAEGEFACDRAAVGLSLFNLSKFYEMKGTFNPANIRNRINEGCGIMIFSDHGNVNGVCYSQRLGLGIGMTSSTGATLTNGHMLPLSVLDACLTHAIDYSESLGEYLVLNPTGGSVNSIGCTRIGYGDYGAWHIESASGYMNVHLMEQFSKGDIMPGKMLDMTKLNYLGYVGIWGYWDTKTLVEYICLGDPATHIGGAGLVTAPDRQSAAVNPGQTAFYRVNFTNTALRGDTVRFEITKGKYDAQTGTDELILKANSSSSITVMVNTPPDGRAFDEDVTTLTITPRSTGLPVRINLTTSIKCIRDSGFAIEKNSYSTPPGKNISINYSITNDGNIGENASVRLSGSGRNWTIGVNDTNIAVEPRTRQTGTLVLPVPVSCLAGQYLLRMEMRTLSNITRTEIVTIDVEKTGQLSVRALGDRAYAFGSAASFGLEFENGANYEQTCELTLEGVPDDWMAYLPGKLTVGAFEKLSAEISTVPGKRTVSGEYPLIMYVVSGGVTVKSFHLTAVVNRSQDLDMHCGRSHVAADTRSDVWFDFEFTSNSNYRNDVVISVTGLPATFEWFIGADKVTVEPFTERTVSLNFRLPPSCPAGRYEMGVFAVSGLWSTTANITIEVGEVRRFDLVANLTQAVLYPDTGVKFPFVIKNTGNCPDVYSLITDCPFVSKFSNFSIALAPGEEKELFITLGVGAQNVPGDYQFCVEAMSTRDPARVKTLVMGVRVEAVHQLVLSYTSSSEMKANQTGTLRVRVSNFGTVSETLTASARIASSWTLKGAAATIAPGDTAELALSFTPGTGTPAGDYALLFDATTDTGRWEVNHTVRILPDQTSVTPARPTSTRTGDANLLPAILGMALAATVVLLVLSLRKKKEQ